jgi:hypothetical protein
MAAPCTVATESDDIVKAPTPPLGTILAVMVTFPLTTATLTETSASLQYLLVSTESVGLLT